jgi:hypothetical protein
LRQTALAWLSWATLLVSCGSNDSAPAPDGPAFKCGNASVAAQLASCRAAADETACKTAGGTWLPVGLPQSATYTCVCPTGQLGCLCRSAADCVAECLADPLGGASGPTCEGVSQYQCSGRVPVEGCFCVLGPSGAAQIQCSP